MIKWVARLIKEATRAGWGLTDPIVLSVETVSLRNRARGGGGDTRSTARGSGGFRMVGWRTCAGLGMMARMTGLCEVMKLCVYCDVSPPHVFQPNL